MKRSLILFMWTLSSVSAFCQGELDKVPLQVHGVVLDGTSGDTLQATIHVQQPEGGKQIAFTDTNTQGHFGLLLKRDAAYELLVELEGYEPSIHNLTTESGPEVEVIFRMVRKDQ